MITTLREARAEARALREQGELARTLTVYHHILQAVPLDYEVRTLVADVLVEAGARDAAAQIYRTVALHDIRAGHPLPALVAAQALTKLGYPIDDDAMEDLLEPMRPHRYRAVRLLEVSGLAYLPRRGARMPVQQISRL